MPRVVRCGLIQASNVKSPAEASLPEIRQAIAEVLVPPGMGGVGRP